MDRSPPVDQAHMSRGPLWFGPSKASTSTCTQIKGCYLEIPGFCWQLSQFALKAARSLSLSLPLSFSLFFRCLSFFHSFFLSIFLSFVLSFFLSFFISFFHALSKSFASVGMLRRVSLVSRNRGTLTSHPERRNDSTTSFNRRISFSASLNVQFNTLAGLVVLPANRHAEHLVQIVLRYNFIKQGERLASFETCCGHAAVSTRLLQML